MDENRIVGRLARRGREKIRIIFFRLNKTSHRAGSAASEDLGSGLDLVHKVLLLVQGGGAGETLDRLASLSDPVVGGGLVGQGEPHEQRQEQERELHLRDKTEERTN